MPLEQAPYVDYVDGNGVVLGRMLVKNYIRDLNLNWGNPRIEAVPHSYNNQAEWCPVRYQPNEPFEATLKITSSQKSGYIVEDETGNNVYQILGSEMFKIMTNHEIVGGTITGIWNVVKVGQAYSLQLLQGIR